MRSFHSIAVLLLCNAALAVSDDSQQQEQDYMAAVLSKWSYSKDDGASLKGHKARWMWGDAGLPFGHKVAKQDPTRLRWSKWLNPEDAIANIKGYSKGKNVERPVDVQIKDLDGDEVVVDTIRSNIAEAIDEMQKWKGKAPCDYTQCTLPPNAQPGNEVCCPQGQTKNGDGSQCSGGERQTCMLHGTTGKPQCSCKAWIRSGVGSRDGEAESSHIIWFPEIDGADKIQVLRDFPPAPEQGMSSDVAFVLVEKNMKKTLYIVFRGNAKVVDMLDGQSIQDNQKAYRMHGVGIHNGVHQEIINRWESFQEEVRDVMQKVVDADERDGSVTDIIFTGHDRGGAHATAAYTMLRLLEEGNVKTKMQDARVVAFGSTMIFTRLLQAGKNQPLEVSSEFVDIMKNCTNYIFRNDPLPRMYKKISDFNMESFFKTNRLGGIYNLVFKMAAFEHVGAILAESIAEYGKFATRYQHFQKIVLLGGDSSTANWETFEFNMDSVKDHAVDNYVSSIRGSQREFTPELRQEL